MDVRKGIGVEDKQNFIQRNLKICILQQFDLMNQYATGFICKTSVWCGENTYNYLIGIPAEKRSLKGIDADGKELLR